LVLVCRSEINSVGLASRLSALPCQTRRIRSNDSAAGREDRGERDRGEKPGLAKS
jgi:hypothetical protein